MSYKFHSFEFILDCFNMIMCDIFGRFAIYYCLYFWLCVELC